MPMAAVAKPSDCARTPSSVDCNPAPSIRTPMPSNKGQVLAIKLAGMVRTARLAGSARGAHHTC